MDDAIQQRIKDACGQDTVLIFSAYEDGDNGIKIDNLDEVPIFGDLIIIQNWTDDKCDTHQFTSSILHSPTWLDLCKVAHDLIEVTGDKHHIFLEHINITSQNQDGLHVAELWMGS